MPFNVDTHSIVAFLRLTSDALSNDLDSDAHFRLLRCALERPLARDLSNRDHASDLRVIEVFERHRHTAWVEASLAAGRHVHEFCPCQRTREQIHHVADWIAAAMLENAAWLSTCDERGRPRKLLKFGSPAQAMREADKAMERRHGSMTHQRLGADDVATVREFGGGARIVALLTSRALDFESSAMRHCVGHGAYDNRLKRGTHRYYALHCKLGKSHATLEVRVGDNALLQCKGRRNRPPARAYRARIRKFIIEQGFKLEEHACHTGLVMQHGQYFNIDRLPSSLVWNSDLDLSFADIDRLPDDLTVKGNLSLTHSKIKALPERLTVHGSLLATGVTIEHLPISLVVRTDLALGDAAVTEIPPGFTVGRHLLAQRSRIAIVGAGIVVGGDLNLCRTPLGSLPDGLTVPGSLFLSGTAIRSLPRNLTCGALNVADSAIETLPSCLIVKKGDINLARTKLKSLPENLRAPAFIDLSGAQLLSLPEVMTIKKYFIADESTRLPSIPSYMKRRLCTGRTIPKRSLTEQDLLQPIEPIEPIAVRNGNVVRRKSAVSR